jgi:hypothetical protein
MGFSWALDDFAAQQNGAGKSASECGQRMVTNALNRWTGGATTPPVFPDGGVDGGVDEPITGDGGLPTEPGGDASVGTNQNAVDQAQTSSCGCQTPGTAVMGGSALASFAALTGLALLRRRRK